MRGPTFNVLLRILKFRSLASSAPVGQFVSDCGTWDTILTQTFESSGVQCAACINNSWPIIYEMAYTGLSSYPCVTVSRNKLVLVKGRQTLNNIFHLCPNSTITKFDDVIPFVSFLTLVYTWFAEFDYPYPTSFLVPLPAWPATVFSSFFTAFRQIFDYLST